MTEIVTLDQFDRKLLALVQKNNLRPARELAEAVGLSESAVLRRLRRMRSEGVIVADVAVVDPAVAGEVVSIHVLVSLERERSFDLDAFIRKIRLRPEVKKIWYVTGEVDFVLLLRLPGMDHYADFVDDVFHADENVKSFKTIVAIREIETGGG
ncbi:Lrp/AsnC family transcriptional regulator [Nitratireductor aquimarinus]|uniref:Lrp/AsnC family transcriptional regulator n=1 Tax=Alphaproteobacteria TaxID=28211 RepID=UPI0019D36C07|nr:MULTISPECIES: Lrp/AsnC family transcriptional regulator [Alphaproteobacteria]MBN7755814.1 Lrp/AsnC family transcriptional regulator [Nitratireductor aquimarinus]MBY5998568.1 Lrp/AsnC family transcriptional regulator [Tritonibacter mobilis]MBY6020600.1 Lrp/AsnC family transcriptional regulator [Nitratireductor sp. DP7N14-4]MCV0379324.1 Lrp/AsnC family transcriptional regulator [Nitratireductor sp.]